MPQTGQIRHPPQGLELDHRIPVQRQTMPAQPALTQAMNSPSQSGPTPASTTAAPVAVLALMMMLVPALGVPSELMNELIGI